VEILTKPAAGIGLTNVRRGWACVTATRPLPDTRGEWRHPALDSTLPLMSFAEGPLALEMRKGMSAHLDFRWLGMHATRSSERKIRRQTATRDKNI